MRLFSWAELGSRLLLDSSVAGTIGVFDGVHRGHLALLEELSRQDWGQNESLVVTFRENPKRLLNPRYLGDLMTWEEKKRILADSGVQNLVVIDFSEAFSRMSGKDFFFTLKKAFRFQRLVLGWDFTFGKGSETTAADLGWYADPWTRLTVLPAKQWNGRTVSSSLVRKAVLDGDFALAKGLMGRPYSLPLDSGFSVVNGRGVLSVQGLKKLAPPVGRYDIRIGSVPVVLERKEWDLTWESPPGVEYQEIVFE